MASIRQARAVSLRPYNEYRRLARFPRAAGFDDVSSDPRVQQGLRDVYGDVDAIEFFPACSPRTSGPTPCCRR